MALAAATWERRKLLDEARRIAPADSRYVNLSIEIRVVERDEGGDYSIPGQDGSYRVVDTVRRGGVFNTLLKLYTSRWEDPVVWHCGREQLGPILHGDGIPSAQLMYGAEGVGKTQILAMWCVLRAIDPLHIGRNGGMTAPTTERIEEAVKSVRKYVRPGWFDWAAKPMEATWVTGCLVKFRTVKKYSAEIGSPIQGYTWAFCGSDEIQDYAKDIDADIEARGRGAPRGRYLRLATATAKDSAQWRSFRDEKDASTDWVIVRLAYNTNPFVAAEHWRRMARNMTDREWKRRGLALDVPPELAVYPTWSRATHLRRIADISPHITDVTDRVLGRYRSYVRDGARFALLVCHDPGEIFQTSTFLRCYHLPSVVAAKIALPEGRRFGDVIWAVVGEFVTKQTTSEQHAAALRKHLQERYELELDPDPLDPDTGLDKALVLRDPHSQAKASTSHEDVDAAFQKHRLDIFSAATGKQVILKDRRIQTVNRLLASGDGEVRLIVDCDEHRQPVAPKVVESIEVQEKDPAGRPEMGKKGLNDKTHPMVATGYGLFAFEQEKFSEHTRNAALGLRSTLRAPWERSRR